MWDGRVVGKLAFSRPKQAASASIEIKRSEFIAYCAPVQTEEEARAFLQSVKQAHPQARHCCYAWSLGATLGQALNKRFSDDGEPQGTAGMPILKKIEASGLQDLAVAVIRYFGGILLGTGGLGRAYSEAAELAIVAAGVEQLIEQACYQLSCDYALYETLRHQARQQGFGLDQEVFSDRVTCRVCFPIEEEGQLLKQLEEISSGQLELEYVGVELAVLPT